MFLKVTRAKRKMLIRFELFKNERFEKGANLRPICKYLTGNC